MTHCCVPPWAQVRMLDLQGGSVIMSQRALKATPGGAPNSGLRSVEAVMEVLQGNIGAVVEVWTGISSTIDTADYVLPSALAHLVTITESTCGPPPESSPDRRQYQLHCHNFHSHF